MEKLLIVYIHLIATCMAIGTIVMTDMRLLAKLSGYRVVIPPPERFETRMMMVALSVLLVSGATLIAMGIAADPAYLSGNGKLQAKILLVGVLCANAFVLHYVTFPRLAQARPVYSWTWRDHLSVALPVGVSNALWFYCAFLGIADSWNSTVSMALVLQIAVVLVDLAAIFIFVVLCFAAREEPSGEPDLVDTIKSKLSNFMALGGR